MRFLIIGAGVLTIILILNDRNKKRAAGSGGGCGCGVPDAACDPAQPAFLTTAATTDISVPGVPEEPDQPMKVCPPTRSVEGVH